MTQGVAASVTDLGRAPHRPARWSAPAVSGAAPTGAAAAYRYLLVLRFGVVNTVAFALLAAAWLQGWVGAALEGDGSRLGWVIVAVFLAGLALCAQRIIQTSRELHQLNEPELRRSGRVTAYCRSVEGRDGPSRAISAATLRLELAARIALVRHIAGSLVVLGLIGTVIGFIVALSGVDPQAAADVTAIGPMVSTLIDGMAIALHTTLIGAVLNVWLMINYRLLETGTVELLAALVERGERHARP